MLYEVITSLFLKPVVIGDAYAPDIALETMPLSESDKKTIEKERADKDTFERKFEAGQKNSITISLLIIWNWPSSTTNSPTALRIWFRNNFV